MRRVYITSQQTEQARMDWPVRWGPIGKQVYDRSYSRKQTDGTREDWFDTVTRVVNGNLNYVGEEFIEKDEPEKLFETICKMRAIPAGRHLWACGIADGKAKQYVSNCFAADFTNNFSEHFDYTFMRLMEGGGVGANYSNCFINSNGGKPWKPKCKVNVHLLCSMNHKDYETLVDTGEYDLRLKDGVPELDEKGNMIYDKTPVPFKGFLSSKYSVEWEGLTNGDAVYMKIDDSREGWRDSLMDLLNMSMSDNEEMDLVFDVSNIRPFGADLRGFGGKASGPGALMHLLNRTADILNTKLNQPLCSLDYMKIDQYIAEAVVAGGTRRSARGAWKYWGDSDIAEFMKCKEDGTGHWTTNISVVIDNKFIRALKSTVKSKRDPAEKVYESIIDGMLRNGEPGFLNASKQLEGEAPGTVFYATNPCGEITMVQYPDMHCFDICCLGHVNLADPEVTDETWRLMARFLLRATFAPTADERTKKNVERNRRIGVGFFGYHNWLARLGIKYSDAPRKTEIKSFFSKTKALITATVQEYAKQLRIPESIKKTTVAPTGSIAQLTGHSTGCQPAFSKRYIRRIRYNTAKDKVLLDEIKLSGSNRIVDDPESANTSVVEFFYRDPIYDETKEYFTKNRDKYPEIEEITEYLDELIEDSMDVSMEDYLETQAMLQAEYVDNSISITINIDPASYPKEQVMSTLRHYLPRIKGLTLFPIKSRPLQPYDRLTREQYEALMNDGFSIESGVAEQSCSIAGCPIK